ncbi:MAG TPA: Gfo/Idh/MocA family oxidoreductase [Bryobacteraceae bacterium]|jgi:hypothetical protein
MENTTSRRDLLRAAALGATALGVASSAAQTTTNKSVAGMPFEAKQTPRMGIIGVGGRGGGMLNEYLAVENLRVTAVCDKDKAAAAKGAAAVARRGQNPPAVYDKGETDYENLVKRDDVDFVYIATPWPWHVPPAIAAMEHGKHALIEVPAAITLEDCWKMVDTSERTRRHCLICENCCFGFNELMVLKMCRAGLLGDLLHGEGAYLHDLRKLLFADSSEGLWRRTPHTQYNGNLYPTHGLGPVANYMGINRGDRFDYMVSVSTPERGLDQYRDANIPKDSPKWKEKYICGDLNTSLIKTANGLTITLSHDVVNGRPYSRVNAITGTKGLFRDYPPRIYFDGAPKEEYTSLDPYKDQWTHKLWKEQGELARKLGTHGGMDFVMVYRIIDCMRKGLPPDIDVYDAAAWSSPGPLSMQSVSQGSMPVKFPDFTRGKWREKRVNLES